MDRLELRDDLVDAATVASQGGPQTTQTKRSSFDGENGALANDISVKSAFNMADDGFLDEDGVLDLGAGADRLGFGGWSKGDATELTVDMGSEATGAMGLDKDRDQVKLLKGIDAYTFAAFEEDGEVVGVTITDTKSGKTINFIDVEIIQVEGLKFSANTATELLAEIDAFLKPDLTDTDFLQESNTISLNDTYRILDGQFGDAFKVDGSTIEMNSKSDHFQFGTINKGDDKEDLTVLMKGGGEDTVSLARSINDYSIKITDAERDRDDLVTITDNHSGQTVTFQGAEQFVFHNTVDGVDYTNDSFSFEELVATGHPVHGEIAGSDLIVGAVGENADALNAVNREIYDDSVIIGSLDIDVINVIGSANTSTDTDAIL